MKNIKKLTALLLLLSLSPISLIIAADDMPFEEDIPSLDEAIASDGLPAADNAENMDDTLPSDEAEALPPVEEHPPLSVPSKPLGSAGVKAATNPAKKEVKKTKLGRKNKTKIRRQRRLQRRNRAMRARAQAIKAGFGSKKALADKKKSAAKARES